GFPRTDLATARRARPHHPVAMQHFVRDAHDQRSRPGPAALRGGGYGGRFVGLSAFARNARGPRVRRGRAVADAAEIQAAAAGAAAAQRSRSRRAPERRLRDRQGVRDRGPRPLARRRGGAEAAAGGAVIGRTGRAARAAGAGSGSRPLQAAAASAGRRRRAAPARLAATRPLTRHARACRGHPRLEETYGCRGAPRGRPLRLRGTRATTRVAPTIARFYSPAIQSISAAARLSAPRGGHAAGSPIELLAQRRSRAARHVQGYARDVGEEERLGEIIALRDTDAARRLQIGE